MAYGPFGTIVSPHGAGVMLTNVATGAEESIAVLPPVGINGHTAWSPDRTRLAISRFARRPATGSGARTSWWCRRLAARRLPVAEHAQDGALLGALAWMPDSSGVYYDRPAGLGRSADDAGGVLAARSERGWATSRSPMVAGRRSRRTDGCWHTCGRPHQSGYLNELVVTDLTSGSEHILVPTDQMVQITSPRFSPDGAEIAFVGSDMGPQALGGPGAVGPAGHPVRQRPVREGRDEPRPAGGYLGHQRLRAARRIA